MFVEKLAKLDGACDFQQSRLRRTLSKRETELYLFIDNYLEEYCFFYGLPVEYVQRVHEKFVREYQCDLKNFSISRKYPSQTSDKRFELSRVDYDVILILSFLLEKHRFRIAAWLVEHLTEEDVLCIGIGPGIELGIISEFQQLGFRKYMGYDLSISDFVKSRYNGFVREEYFNVHKGRYNAILLIEILEHLTDPEKMIRMAADSLVSGGRLFLTTAIDMPQFDHLYNFVQGEIVEMLEKNCLTVASMMNVEHVLNINKVSSSNELIIGEKRP